MNSQNLRDLKEAVENSGATEVAIDSLGRISYFIPGKGWTDGKGYKRDPFSQRFAGKVVRYNVNQLDSQITNMENLENAYRPTTDITGNKKATQASGNDTQTKSSETVQT